ncbi:MAG: galactose/methyl galactoside ABC transporter permease MglC [Oscillospiraceae bacterium]
MRCSAVTKKLDSKRIKSILMNSTIYIVMILFLLVIIIIEPGFLNLNNFTYILQQAAPRIVLAMASASICIIGGRDLSTGRQIGLAAIICAVMLQAQDYAIKLYPNLGRLPLFVPLLIAMAIGAVCSMINSLLVSKLHMVPMIASLGMQMVIYGAMSVYYDDITGGTPIAGLDKAYTNFCQGSFYIFNVRIPYIVCYALAVALIYWFIWNRTKLGRNMFACGGNPEAAKVSGVSVVKTSLIVYLLAGCTYAFAGFLEAGRTASVTNEMGNGYELDAIAGCVIGGVSLRGGIGTIRGVLVGVLLLQIINYGLVYLGVNPYFSNLARGAIMLFAIAIDIQKNIKKK